MGAKPIENLSIIHHFKGMPASLFDARMERARRMREDAGAACAARCQDLLAAQYPLQLDVVLAGAQTQIGQPRTGIR